MKRRTLMIAVVVAVALGGEVVLAGSALAAHRLQQRREARYAGTRNTLRALKKSISKLQVTLSATEHDVTTRTQETEDAKAQLAATQRLLDALNQQLAAANDAASGAQASLVALDFCNAASDTARLQRDNGDAAGAIATLRGATASCATAIAVNDPDPAVFPFDFPDPTITRVGSTYFAYATNGVLGNIQLATSSDLQHWTAVGDALPFLPVWADPGNTWAPSVVALGGKYVMYYSPRSKGGNQCISVATAATPFGPFVDTSTEPSECTSHYALDPKAFVDAHGSPWLVWKNGVGDAIWSQQLSADGLHLVGAPTKLIAVSQAWEQRNVEAPALVEAGGQLHLFYSGSDWNSGRYGIGDAICDTPAGPCHKPHDGPLLTSHDDTAGPGGADFFTASDGRLYATFHAYRAPNVGYPSSRLLHVTPVQVSGEVVHFGG